MTGQGKEVNPHLCYINIYFSYRLGGITVKYYSILPCNAAEFLYGLNGSYFIIGMHDTCQYRVLADSFFKIPGSYQTLPVHRKISYIKSLVFKIMTNFKNSRMFDRGSDQMMAFPCIGKSKTFNCHIV